MSASSTVATSRPSAARTTVTGAASTREYVSTKKPRGGEIETTWSASSGVRSSGLAAGEGAR
jgi:hypothetical protein